MQGSKVPRAIRCSRKTQLRPGPSEDTPRQDCKGWGRRWQARGSGERWGAEGGILGLGLRTRAEERKGILGLGVVQRP